MSTFGIKREGKNYKIRKGVYALMEGEPGQVVLVGRIHGDLHELPGGGLEGKETHHEGLVREIQEELGWAISIGGYLGKGTQYTTLSPRGKYYRLEGHFYMAEKVRVIGGKTELDHVERPLAFQEAYKKVKYDYQKWAIELFEKEIRL